MDGIFKGKKDNSKKHPARDQARQLRKFQDGKERNARWQTLDPLARVAELDSRLGKGVGARHQRAKLEILVKEETAQIARNVAVAITKPKKKR